MLESLLSVRLSFEKVLTELADDVRANSGFFIGTSGVEVWDAFRRLGGLDESLVPVRLSLVGVPTELADVVRVKSRDGSFLGTSGENVDDGFLGGMVGPEAFLRMSRAGVLRGMSGEPDLSVF